MEGGYRGQDHEQSGSNQSIFHYIFSEFKSTFKVKHSIVYCFALLGVVAAHVFTVFPFYLVVFAFFVVANIFNNLIKTNSNLSNSKTFIYSLVALVLGFGVAYLFSLYPIASYIIVLGSMYFDKYQHTNTHGLLALAFIMFGMGFLVEVNFVSVLILSMLFVDSLLLLFTVKSFNFKSFIDQIFFSSNSPENKYLIKFSFLVAIVFGLGGFNIIPALALSNLLVTTAWVAVIALHCSNKNISRIEFIMDFTLLFIALSVVANPGVGVFTAISLGLNSTFLLSLMPFFLLASILIVKFNLYVFSKMRMAADSLLHRGVIVFGGFVSFAGVVANPGVGFLTAISLGFSSIFVWVAALVYFVVYFVVYFLLCYLLFRIDLEKLFIIKNKNVKSFDRRKAQVNIMLFAVLAYVVTSYVMSPLGTPLTAMLSANSIIAYLVAIVIWSIATSIVNNTKFAISNNTKDIDDNSPKFKPFDVFIFVFASFVMSHFLLVPALDVSLRLLLIASLTFGMLTLQRTYQKYKHNIQKTSGHDRFLVKVGKGLIILFAAGAAYVFATILPMFAGLVIPSYMALLSALSVLNVPGLVAASFAAFYATNIVTIFVKPDGLSVGGGVTDGASSDSASQPPHAVVCGDERSSDVIVKSPCRKPA